MPGHGARVDVGALADDDDVVELGLRLGFDEAEDALPQRLGRQARLRHSMATATCHPLMAAM